jgi:hypothetical protein
MGTPSMRPRRVRASLSGWRYSRATWWTSSGGDLVDAGGDFVEGKEAAEVEPLAGEVGHPGVGAFEAEEEGALHVLLGVEEFLGREGFFLEAAELLEDAGEEWADGGRGGSGVDGEAARVVVELKFGKDVVGEALAFADVLEEAGAHAAAEDDVKGVGGVAQGVVDGVAGGAEAEVDLLEGAFVLQSESAGGGVVR